MHMTEPQFKASNDVSHVLICGALIPSTKCLNIMLTAFLRFTLIFLSLEAFDEMVKFFHSCLFKILTLFLLGYYLSYSIVEG